MTRNQMDMMMYSNSNSNNGSPGDMGRLVEQYEPEPYEQFEEIQVKHEKMEDL